MWYVMTNDGCVGEYEYINDACERAEMLEDAWVCTEEDLDEETIFRKYLEELKGEWELEA